MDEKHLPVLEKYLERSFMLATFQIWYKGERTAPKVWTKSIQPFEPYMVAEWREKSAIAYYDSRGIQWVKSELKRMSQEDSKFFDWLISESKRSYDILCPIFESKALLKRDEFAQFVLESVHAWSLLEAVWFLIEDIEEVGGKIQGQLEKLLAVRKYTEHLVPGIDETLQRSFEVLYPEMKEYVHFILLEEAISGSLPSLETLSKRKHKYCFFNDRLFVERNIEELGLEFGFKIQSEVLNPRTVNTIHGKIAQSGVVQGTVCIIRSRADLPKCKQGDIIVSPTTTPDFMPAMIICGGIIADEGGIVSHAAITSRELKKPCIIGTKIATQVLKDGDLVEVDAERGVVTILNHA